MPSLPQEKPISRLLVVMPTWLGDCVMATPTLRALRELYPQAHISALIQEPVRPILLNCPWVDRLLAVRRRRDGKPDRRRGPVRLARRLARGRFDAAVLLPNSFRSAMIVAMAGIPRRIGYERDGRGFMLTDRLLPQRKAGGFTPVPTLEYYLGIARYLGATDPDGGMRLFTDKAGDQAADELLARAGYPPGVDQPLVLLNPGANKPQKRWPADRFARLADKLADSHRAVVAVTGAPREREVLRAVVAAARTPVIDLSAQGLNLTLLKSIVRRASLMITNDTGPRHIAAALRTPVVTLFGPTGPEWTEIGFEHERQVVAPCIPRGQKGKDEAFRRMIDIPLDAVVACSKELLDVGRSLHESPAAVNTP